MSRLGGQRVASSDLSTLQEDPSRVRNVCILAHVDHGKTTLSDGLVCSNGIISSKLAGKLRYLDSTEDEQKRGITMHSSAISLLYKAQPKQPRPTPGPRGAGADKAIPDNSSAEPPASAAEGVGAENSFLINLIDSPGHIDFSSDVSTATRLCDCALVVVDVLEGVCAQTHAVFRQARAEQMRPLLVLNKVDRLASELKLTPLEAWQHLHRLVENVNALTATLVSADECAELDEAAARDTGSGDGVAAAQEASSPEEDLEGWTFSPEYGNVVFCSALDGWGFGLGDFARLWAKRVGCKPRELRRMLWGSFVLNAKTKKVTKWTPSSQNTPMFVSMILDPIWQLYDAAVQDKNSAKAGRMAAKLGLDIPPRELASTDPRTVLQSVMKRWLPLSEAVLRMVVERGPSPAEAQSTRVDVLWPPSDESLRLTGAGGAEGGEEDNARIMVEMGRVRRAVAACDASPSAPVVIFVSKMIPVKKRDITDADGKLWEPPPAAGAAELSAGLSESGTGGDAEDDRDSLAFVAFARVLSGTVAPDTPLLVLGPKYHPLKQGAWTHASPLGNDWTPPDSVGGDPAAATGRKDRPPNRLFTRRRRPGDDVTTRGEIVADSNSSDDGDGGGGGRPSSRRQEGRGIDDNLALFMMMGAALQPVARVPAGNVLALAGLEGRVNKCATLSDTAECPAMRAVTLQAKPMVRVAVEALHQQDMNKLELGLSRLYQADPAVEVSVTTRGEHIVCCLGELHLEQSLKDLRERYACVELKASLPLVPFRETIVAPGQVVGEDGSIIPPPQRKIAPWSDEEGLSLTDFKTGRARVVTPDKRAALTLRCLPLPVDVGKLVEAHPNEVRMLSEELGAARISRAGEGVDPLATGGQADPAVHTASGTRPSSFRQDLLHALREASPDSGGTTGGSGGGGAGGAGWNESEGEGFLARALAFGPRGVGTNLLARCAGGVEVRVAKAGDSIEETPTNMANNKSAGEAGRVGATATASEDTATAASEVRQASEEEVSEALRLIENSVITGFQLATLAGPLAGEELHGLCFLLEKVEITADCLTSGSSGSSPSTATAVVPPPTPPPGDPGNPTDGRDSSSSVAPLEDGSGTEEGVGTSGEGSDDDSASVGKGSVKTGVAGERRGLQPLQQDQRRRYGPLTGQIISVVRMGCRASMLCCPVRLVEAFYRCSLQCDQLQLGNMYAVLSKRRGRVVDEDLVEGTQLFLLTALLPVAESFGFADELLKKTSGAGTTPQLAFSHWEVMELDPFWRPQTEEEREDEGEEGHLSVTNIARQYLDGVRKRKGLATNDKIVVAAEKQRTLTRNK